jgi:signal peptidase II
MTPDAERVRRFPRVPRRALRAPLAWLVLAAVLAAGLTLDLFTKHWTFRHVAPWPVVLNREVLLADPHWRVPPHPPRHIIPGDLLDFRLVINRGAVFGIGPNHRVFFIFFTLLALVAGVFVFARYTTDRTHLAHVAIALILAGGLGNLYDRIAFAVVRDFMHMLPGWTLPFGWHYPRVLGGGNEVFPWVFNAADVMLLVGMALLMLHINRHEKQKRAAEAAAGSPGESAALTAVVTAPQVPPADDRAGLPPADTGSSVSREWHA